jgi:hypothetical protein
LGGWAKNPSIELYKQSLEGNNYSPQSIKAYLGDIGQFVAWLKTRRVDFDIPYRIARIDIVELLLLRHTRKFIIPWCKTDKNHAQ